MTDMSKTYRLLWIPATWVFLVSLKVIQDSGAGSIFSGKLPTNGKSVLIIGDSHTGPYQTWAENFVKQAGFKTFVKKADVGKTTDWMLAQLKAHYAVNQKPDYVIVWGGANDAYNNVAQSKTLANMQAMIDLAKSKGSKIIFVSGYDPAKVSYNFNTQYLLGTQTTLAQGRERFIALLKEMPKKLKGYTKIIPPNPNFTRANSTDGLHLTSQAYLSFSNWLANNYFGGKKS